MKLKQLVGELTIAGALSAAAFGVGTGAAYADPGHPGDPGGGHGAPANPGGGGGPGGGGPAGLPAVIMVPHLGLRPWEIRVADLVVSVAGPALPRPVGIPAILGPETTAPAVRAVLQTTARVVRAVLQTTARVVRAVPATTAPAGREIAAPAVRRLGMATRSAATSTTPPGVTGPRRGEPVSPRGPLGRPLPPPGGEWRDGPINYYGYQETPVWNPQFNQWGSDFFGVLVPL